MSILAIGRKVTVKRIERGWDKSTLAKNAGLNHSIVVRAEKGGGVSPATAKAIADALEAPVFDLFELVEGISTREAVSAL